MNSNFIKRNVIKILLHFYSKSEFYKMLFLLLKNIRLNPQTNLYETIEAGLTYQIDPALLDSSTAFFKNNPHLLLDDWYRSLDKTEQEKVKLLKQFDYQL